MIYNLKFFQKKTIYLFICGSLHREVQDKTNELKKKKEIHKEIKNNNEKRKSI